MFPPLPIVSPANRSRDQSDGHAATSISKSMRGLLCSILAPAPFKRPRSQQRTFALDTDLWVAKTSTATKNETVLGREGLNTILASTQREDFGGQNPFGRTAHIHIKDSRKVDPR
jgi:hypothetical protein